ncbi:hypothetical protein [Sulfurimonas sp.]|uniref:hypothetical protein n=1 Tax=Sulfurimonas sp. TaxID=2022749 RepID=UPI002AB12F8E|nr:hypothetical protein [Sulfurimonas sp.]
MKYLLLLFALSAMIFADDTIVNDTNEPMLCRVSYPAVFEQEVIHGIQQRIQVEKQESFMKILKPGKTLVKKRDGNIVCYNKLQKISIYNKGNVQKLEGKRLESFIKNHELFDIASYINENKQFIDAKYGVSNQCQPYKGGKYCKRINGLDIFYNKEGRVKKLFIYDRALVSSKGKPSPFEVNSFYKIKIGSEPLGLWVSDKNKKLIKSKPSFESDNVIIWEKPIKGIKQIVLTAKNGHINIYGNRYNRRNKNKKVVLQDYLQAIEVEYALDDKAYALHQKSRPMPEVKFQSMKNNYQKQNLPIKAKITWGKYLNPKNKIPTNKFKAFYINTNKPRKVIASEIVPKVSVNYPYSEFHDIKSEDFGGYWVGNFTYDKTQKMHLSTSQSWAKTRIIIDGMVIYEGSNNSQIPFTFTKGKHKIEVEYVNNWHTTNFKLVIKEKEKKYSSRELKKELKKYNLKDSQVLFVGAYKSDTKSQSTILKIAKSSKPIILVLNSYHSIEWIIKNPYKVKIKAVVYSSRHSGVVIKGDISKSIPILQYQNTLGSYSMEKKCICVNGGASFHCEGRNALNVLKDIKKVIGKKVFGYSTKHRADTLMVPNTIFDTKKKKELEKEIVKNEKLRKDCQKKSNPEFENIFK